MVDFLIQSPLEHFARVTPENPALSASGEQLSYAELDRASNQLANAFILNGVDPHQRIGIFHHKALELGIGIYGILKAGCAFVPLDPFMPADRLAFIIRDCNISHLVSSNTQAKTLSKLQGIDDLHVYGVDKNIGLPSQPWSEIRLLSTDNPNVTIIDQDLGYIMYTSGSTGSPKGMMHTHHGSVTYANWGKTYVGMLPSDRVASHAPLHFDLSIFDFFSTARAGATVVLVPEAVTRFPASWTQYIESEKISIVFTVPYTLITMMEQGAVAQRDLSSLRWILFGGEPYPPTKLRVLMEHFPEVKLTNIYGPAEAPCCTCYDVPNPLPSNYESLPIGIVSSNSADLIIDDNDQPCTTGEPGEYCIRSSTLMRGYWNRPELNEKAFLDINEPGKLPIRYYRTGDRVVRDQDGQLRFLGRLDRMIKTRGHRVELDEIETVLNGHIGVMEAAAYTVPDEHDSVSVLVAVERKSNYTIDANELFALARAKLPPYAVPREITVMTAIPHTSSGKIDRKALTNNWLQQTEQKKTQIT